MTTADGPYRVLFLCTGNSARSILAEAILNRIGGHRFKAFSAGSHPTGVVNPVALQLLGETNHDTTTLRSKSWDEFAGPDAVPFDFIFTVCDNAARETCPVWTGHPMTIHWGLPDPASAPEERRREAFDEVYATLYDRLQRFVALPLESPGPAMKQKLQGLGQTTTESPGP